MKKCFVNFVRVLMDSLHYRLSFDQDKKNEIFCYSWKEEDRKICNNCNVWLRQRW